MHCKHCNMLLTEIFSCGDFNCISSNEDEDEDLKLDSNQYCRWYLFLSSPPRTHFFPFVVFFRVPEELKSMGSLENGPSHKALLEFFAKCFQKIFVIKRARTCYLLVKRPGCYHSASKTHVRDRIFKLNPIHASVIYHFP